MFLHTIRGFITFCLLFLAPGLAAQQTWSLKFKPALNFPVNNAVESATGYGFDLTVGYPIASRFIAEAGWGQNTFPGKQPDTSHLGGYDERRFLAGFQFFWPLNNARLTLMTGADAVFSHIAYGDASQKVSQKGTGWRVNAGPCYALSEKLNITPTFSYTTVFTKRSNHLDNISLQFLSLHVEISYFLGKRDISKKQNDDFGTISQKSQKRQELYFAP